ncbi:MAG TPA: tRNA (adenosine(37)-N6)-dimethylallyltransferase MiaA [Candidatus Humimicrobiaceae bacterium]
MKILDKGEINFIQNNKKYFEPDFLSVRQSMLEKKIIPIICGPTCTGKSALAFNLAKIFETDIISIDSMQVYKGLDIGTDKYDSSQIGINQYMTDIFKPDHKLTVVEFRDICRNTIEEEFFNKGRIPIMAGGSGLYLRAVIDELDFTADNDSGNVIGEDYGRSKDNKSGKENGKSSVNNIASGKENIGGIIGEDGNKIREGLYCQAESSEGGLLGLYAKLKEMDPVYAAKISPNDKKRIIRAIEVYTLTGRPFSSFQNKWKARKSIYNCIIIGLLTQKEMLYANIEKRTDRMFENGLINEVQALTEQGYKYSNSLAQAVGYKEVLRYLGGDIDMDMCRQEIVKNTKRLAKKQMTWFKADPRINWIRTDNYDNIFELIANVFEVFNLKGF